MPHLVLVEARLDGDGGAGGAEVAAGARHEGDVEVRRGENLALVTTEPVKHQLLKPVEIIMVGELFLLGCVIPFQPRNLPGV